MMQFDQILSQALMDANLADLESICQQMKDVEVSFSPRYLRERMKLLAAPWKWIEYQEPSSRRRRLDWKLIALTAALLLLSGGGVHGTVFPVVPLAWSEPRRSRGIGEHHGPDGNRH